MSSPRTRPAFAEGGLSARAILALLAVALLAPVVLFAGSLLARLSAAERAHFEDRVLDNARRTVLALDRDASGLELALHTLSTSNQLDRGDYAGFYAQAVQVSHLLNADIILRGTDSQQLVNTYLPWGAVLPKGNNPEQDRQTIAGGKPVISGLIHGQISGRYLVNITVPVWRDKRVVALLSASVRPDRFNDLIHAQNLPPGWAMVLLDRNGKVLARGKTVDATIGNALDPELLPPSGESAAWLAHDPEGGLLVAGAAVSSLSDYRVVVTAPESEEQLMLQSSYRLLVLYGSIAAIMSVLGGLGLGSLISQPLRRLARAADALSRDQAVPSIRTPVREIRRLADVLSAASRHLRDRARERDTVEEQLRELARTLETRVVERTHELSEANAALVQEMNSRETAEQQLRQLQKMEAVGQLTGGIAHDFNNMLAVVISGLTLAQRRLARGDTDIGRFVNTALDGAGRAAALTRRLLAFSRQQALAPEPLDANHLVTGMQELLRRTLGEAVRIETAPGPDLWPVHADPSQLESALLNLAVNARDAMPDGGRLVIETANVGVTHGDARLHPDVPPGDYVLIAVTDTGAGIPPDLLARVFDPFFTTKPVGKGTGLGLSQVYGFVKQTGGHVRVESEPGHGTAVRIYLPRHDVVPGGSSGPLPADAGATASQPTLILVVEDEERVREVSVAALRELGYDTLAAADGAEALRLLDLQGSVRLLFTDIVMPDMNGRKLAEEALRRRPDLKVLYTTGFDRDAAPDDAPNAAFIAKPFSINDLARKVSAVLAGEAG